MTIDGSISVDMKRVKARKDAVVRQSNEGVTNWLKTMENLTVYEGHGRLESATSVRVNGDLLKADKIILNVGARALAPARLRHRPHRLEPVLSSATSASNSSIFAWSLPIAGAICSSV